MKSLLRHCWLLTAASLAGVVLVFVAGVGTASAHALCPESVNPHGQTIPPAGATLPGPKGGQNPDGFYLLTFDVNVVGQYDALVTDLGSGKTFGPYPVGTVIKYTQAPGTTPGEKKIGSTNGQAGAVFTHITGNGDFSVTAVWASTNTHGGTPGLVVGSGSGQPPITVTCYVPPPPK